MAKFLVTGTAGFIGFHLASSLLEQGEVVVGVDNINDYYDINLKYERLRNAGILKENIEWGKTVKSIKWQGYRFIRMDIEDKKGLMELYEKEKFEYVIHLAAQAGVRYSIDNPDAYIKSNIVGFLNILEACRYFPVKFLLYASSSSVYGNNQKVPFSEEDNVDHPISLYAATKRSNELMAYTYSHLFKVPSTGLRFFTVYGPWGRPDMAIYKFTEAIFNGNPIQVFNEGNLLRDFTFIDDIIAGILGILKNQQSEKPLLLMNIGNHSPVSINTMLSIIELQLNMKAVINYLPLQPGDVNVTFADTDRINSFCGFRAHTDIKEGIKYFCDWYLNYKLGEKGIQ
jgi:UDP-glucuronate 4-epimerase